MYLFTRSARLAPGRMRESMTWAAEITGKVNQISELPFQLWRPAMSPGVGRLVWSTATDDLAALEAVEDKLLADEGYIGLLDSGAAFASGDQVDDQLVTLVHAPPDVGSRDIAYAAVVTASVANGHFAQALDIGVRIAQIAERAGGAATSFGISTTGGYAQVGWITGYDDIGQFQRSEEAVNTDPELVQLLDGEAASTFIPGTGQQTLLRRVM
jgi:hypothetical protein